MFKQYETGIETPGDLLLRILLLFLLIGLVLMTLSLNAGLSDVRTDTDRGFSWFEFTLGASVAILGGLMVVAAPYVPKDPASIETEASRVVRDHDPS